MKSSHFINLYSYDGICSKFNFTYSELSFSLKITYDLIKMQTKYWFSSSNKKKGVKIVIGYSLCNLTVPPFYRRVAKVGVAKVWVASFKRGVAMFKGIGGGIGLIFGSGIRYRWPSFKNGWPRPPLVPPQPPLTMFRSIK